MTLDISTFKNGAINASFFILYNMEVTKKLANELLKTALIQLKTSSDFKRKRFLKINEAIEMLLGKTKPKLRQQFNVPLPVLSGLFDTMCADLDDPVVLKVKNNPGKNLRAVEGINTTINISKKSLKPNARWDYKDRISRKYAITYGRGILKYFSVANPYSNTLEATNPANFHCQPKGGGILERHLFCGEEGIIKTKSQLEKGAEDGYYDKEGVALLIERAGSREYQEKISSQQDDNDKRFKALGLDADNNNFVGEVTFNLCEWVLTKYGERFYLLFDPWTRTWLRCGKLKEDFSSDFYPWTTYATHEDDEVFWSTSILADVLFPIAESIVTMFNQELTNRQKRNLNARLYDKDMITNVSKLDEAQYRPDALVPVDTQGGNKRLDNATFAFTTPELTGTIDMITWLDDFTGKQTGIYQNTPSSKGKKTNNVVYAEIQQMAKRVDYRSHSYTECWGEIVLRHVQGLKDNLRQEEAFNLLGPVLGYDFVKDLKQIKLDKDDIEIISTKTQAQEDALRKAQKEKSLGMLPPEIVNQEWRNRHILSDIGGWEEDEINDALDMRGLGAERDQLSAADLAISDILKGKEPEICWSATTIFQRKIMDFAIRHKLSLGDKYEPLVQYVRAHNQFVMENMMQLALRQKGFDPNSLKEVNPGNTPEPKQPTQPQNAPQPTPPPKGGSTIQKGAGSEPTGQAGAPTPIQVNQQ